LKNVEILKLFEFEKYLDKKLNFEMFRFKICFDLKYVLIWKLFRFENYSDLKNVPIENVLVWKVQNENMFIFSIKKKKKGIEKKMWRTRKKKNQRIFFFFETRTSAFVSLQSASSTCLGQWRKCRAVAQTCEETHAISLCNPGLG
jgi:hypothetical protein